MTPGTVAEHVSHATFLPGRMLRSTPPQTPNRSSRSSAAWRHSTSTGQRLHHLTAIARWAASSAVHSSRVMGSLQRGRSPAAARDRSARLSPSVAVIGWAALGVRRHGSFRGVNTFRRRRRFNVAAPKAGGKSPGAVCVDRTCKWGHRFGLAWPPHGGELILEAVGPAGPMTQPLVKVLGSQLPIPSYLSQPYDLPGRTNQNNPIRNRS
jgi:hypothetical protein